MKPDAKAGKQGGHALVSERRDVVLDAVLTEAEVEGYYLADEICTNNEELHAYLQQKLKDVPAEYMPHDALKAFSAKAKFAIRTGEFSPYPNVILRAGVVF